jgi:hypothetical protein
MNKMKERYYLYNIFYGATMLEGEAKSVHLLDLSSDTGNITKVVDCEKRIVTSRLSVF